MNPEIGIDTRREAEDQAFLRLKQAVERENALLTTFNELSMSAPDRQDGLAQAVDELGSQIEAAVQDTRKAVDAWNASLKEYLAKSG